MNPEPTGALVDKNSREIHVRMSREMLNWLAENAKPASGMSMSQVVRNLVYAEMQKANIMKGSRNAAPKD